MIRDLTSVSTAEHYFPGFGWVSVTANERGLIRLAMQVNPEEEIPHPASCEGELCAAARTVAVAFEQLGEYFAKARKTFSVPIDWLCMRTFQQQVLRIAAAIPFGAVRTYGEIALEMRHPGAARAVGRALATNPVGIILPCHRVVGADGSLHGFSASGGLATKAWLLELEGVPLENYRVLLPVTQPAIPGLLAAVPGP